MASRIGGERRGVYTVDMSSPDAGIRRRLFLAREAAKLRPADVAAALKVTTQMVGRWERGKSSPSLEEFADLCELYGVPCFWILRGASESASSVYGKAMHIAMRDCDSTPRG